MSLFEGKDSALDRENHCGLKLTDQVLAVVERVTGKNQGIYSHTHFGFMR